jgi:hypothetical protein
VGSTTSRKLAGSALEVVWSSFRDLLPIILVVVFFQAFVFRQWPEDLDQLLIGTFLVVGGLSLFVAGLQMALFPIGEAMANDFAVKGSMPWMLVFAFALGFGTTFAEPALIAIGDKAAELKFPDSQFGDDQGRYRGRFSFVLRTTVAFSVGLALLIGVIRIIKGWPIQYLIIPGYMLIMLATPLAPNDMVAIAYDSGGVTTSTITVPLTTALGVGLASSIRGRNPMLDGFGLIALASLTPILFVLLMGIFWQ